MKKITAGIIMIATLLLTGCGSAVTNKALDLSGSSAVSSSSSLSDSRVDSSTSSLASRNSSDYAKTYENESHKDLRFGKLSVTFDDYHIVSDTRSNDAETFQCKINQGESLPETHMSIKIRAIEKQDFPNTESIVSYLGNMISDYEKISIYDNVTDASGIISLYCVTGGELTDYVVCYKDDCYLIQSDYSVLDVYLFKSDPSPNYEIDRQKIKCAGSFTTNVNQAISYNKDEFQKSEYDIMQGKGGAKYTAELTRDEESQYHFTLKNEKAEKLLTLSTYGEFYDVIKILDVNMDGYADIRFLEEPGTFNNSYALYVWDASARNFVKVKCNEMLSEFDVHDGYLLNQQKADAGSGVTQKLVWDKNALVKVSEEQYHTG
jgi:major membrane immunogen (membrane-anchored lipoprotein)